MSPVPFRKAPDPAPWDTTGLTDAQRHAIARTLEDLTGWGTLLGRIRVFDADTGARLPQPVREVGGYDRHPRHGLPKGWIDLFIQARWLDLGGHPSGYVVWRPTLAGLRISDQWMPSEKRR